MLTVTSYFKEIIGRISGDNNSVIAAHNERKSRASINSQIAALESKIVDAEEEVSDAKEKLMSAKYPITKITDNTSYLKAFSEAKQLLATKEEALEELKSLLKDWRAEAKELFKEVSA